jgi:hypothetical protein
MLLDFVERAEYTALIVTPMGIPILVSSQQFRLTENLQPWTFQPLDMLSQSHGRQQYFLYRQPLYAIRDVDLGHDLVLSQCLSSN